MWVRGDEVIRYAELHDSESQCRGKGGIWTFDLDGKWGRARQLTVPESTATSCALTKVQAAAYVVCFLFQFNNQIKGTTNA
jgi:hypothetical protein